MTVAPQAYGPLTRVMFLSDLDGTWLSKNRANTEVLNQGVQALRDEYRARGIDFEWGYITARPPERVAIEKLPTPAFTVTYNGGCIQQGGPGHFDNERFVINPGNVLWDRANAASNYNGPHVVEMITELLKQQKYQNLTFHTIGQKINSTAADACPYMDAMCFDRNSIRLTPEEARDSNHDGLPDIFDKETFKVPAQIQALMDDLSDTLEGANIGYDMSPGYPGAGPAAGVVMFDATSPIADKGHAISFISHLEKIPAHHFIIAGDGGNDISMLHSPNGVDDGRRAIVVGGLKELYREAGHLRNAILQPADMDCSLAVLDGLRRHLESIAQEIGR